MKIKITDEDTGKVQEVNSRKEMERIVYGKEKTPMMDAIDIMIILLILAIFLLPFFIIK